MNSLAGLTFDSLPIRFVEHPEGKYGFGIVAEDLAIVLEASDGRNLVRSLCSDWVGSQIMSTNNCSQTEVII